MMKFMEVFFVFKSTEVGLDDFGHSNVGVGFCDTVGMWFDGRVKKCNKHFI